jgi:hypothetical protein
MDEYAEFIRGFIQKNAIMEKTFLVIVPFYPRSLAEQKQSFMKFIPFLKADTKKDANGKTQSEEEVEKFFKQNVEQLNQRTAQVMNNLLNIGLEATLLENDALVELFYNFYNPQTVEREDMAIPRS